MLAEWFFEGKGKGKVSLCYEIRGIGLYLPVIPLRRTYLTRTSALNPKTCIDSMQKLSAWIHGI